MAWGFWKVGQQEGSFDLFHGEGVAKQLQRQALCSDQTAHKNLALLISKK